ncbi:HTH-type transcriptional repressor FabR [Arsukibacterium indicum]|uniref:HTH-type transcriptional repressor FabR n=1 Tax=Arsukibacterium indicum TaxID=2848612 RepID=A0ABS6MPV3_9GAMM|nr:HTH-type transcriptional repressor FabR [Arsukibacterium indicum]MBV2130837.1 HTH-type transcriptional repressor FabR [Arsukibacterium indicum]
MSRAQQKERTRKAIIEAAFSQLSAEKSFASLSLREVAREAGIAPTSFYRHFADMDELGLTLVDEAGLMLRQLMRQARQRIENNGSVISTSIETFMEFVTGNSNVFRLLLRERSGTSAAFRAAVAREIQHFSAELAHYLRKETACPDELAQLQAEAMVTLVFHTGADALDAPPEQYASLTSRTVTQLRWLAHGAASYGRNKAKS